MPWTGHGPWDVGEESPQSHRAQRNNVKVSHTHSQLIGTWDAVWPISLRGRVCVEATWRLREGSGWPRPLHTALLRSSLCFLHGSPVSQEAAQVRRQNRPVSSGADPCPARQALPLTRCAGRSLLEASPTKCALVFMFTRETRRRRAVYVGGIAPKKPSRTPKAGAKVSPTHASLFSPDLLQGGTKLSCLVSTR